MFSFDDFSIMFRSVASSGRGNFSEDYKAFSVSMLPGNDRQDIENGGKIIMPQSALQILTQLNVEYPMLFKMINSSKSRTSHCGVLEFIADEGKCYLPNWMMKNLSLEEGDTIKAEIITLPVATFSKFQALSTDFLDITNPKAVLENALRNFACLTTGDVIAIKYNKKIYELSVLETKPGRGAVSIIECDMNVEFEAPVGYEEPTTTKAATQAAATDSKLENGDEDMRSFDGVGMRLDGKPKKIEQLEEKDPIVEKKLPRGIPDYNYVLGNLTFDRNVKPISDSQENSKDSAKNTQENNSSNTTNNNDDDDQWGGEGFSMRKNE